MTTLKTKLRETANGQANYLNVNEALAQIDQLMMPAALDKDLATPPGSPADGALYIVAASPTGAWVGHAGHLAYWLNSAGAWTFMVPLEGWRIHLNDEDKFYKYTGAAWVDDSAAPSAGAAIAFAAKPNTGITQNLNTGVFTKLLFQVEQFDTNNFYDNSNSRFQPTLSGYYLITAIIAFNHVTTDSGRRLIGTIYKNGAAYASVNGVANNQTVSSMTVSALVFLNGSSDYIEMYGRPDTASNTTFNVDAPIFSASYVGS